MTDRLDHLHVNRLDPLPIQNQLLDQLRYHITVGEWGPGAVLPSVRHLAGSLGINYNTARAVYQQLEREGYVVSERGRGTFVVPRPAHTTALARSIDAVADESLADARESGFAPEDFARAVSARARAAVSSPSNVRMLFAECNPAERDFHSSTIQKTTGVTPESFLLSELEAKDRAVFSSYDLLVTTLYHVAELQKRIGPELRSIGLMVTPSFSKLLKPLMGLPRGARVGLVCTTEQNARRYESALRGSGLYHLRFLPVALSERKALTKVFATADLIFISRMVERRQPNRWPTKRQVEIYRDEIDRPSLRYLRENIAAISQRARTRDTAAAARGV